MVRVAGIKWTETELFQLLTLYCEIPFGKLHARNPEIIELAKRLHRTPSAVALKMVNFASLDPTLSQKGMTNVSALDRKIWDEFFSNIDHYFSLDNEPEDGLSERTQEDFLSGGSYDAIDVLTSAKARRGQQRFRRVVLASYDRQCAISDISDEQLLVASHIAPWATHKSRRLDPRNGICLNALLDRTFDAGLIALSDECDVIFSPHLSRETIEKISRMGTKFRIPTKFAPDVALLREHRRHFGFS